MLLFFSSYVHLVSEAITIDSSSDDDIETFHHSDESSTYSKDSSPSNEYEYYLFVLTLL